MNPPVVTLARMSVQSVFEGKMSMKTSTVVSVAHAGGQGKTTVAQMLYLAAKKAGLGYKMVSADFVDQPHVDQSAYQQSSLRSAQRIYAGDHGGVYA